MQRLTTTVFYFNPRPPCGGRREKVAQHPDGDAISIHVLRVEDDTAAYTYYMGARNFNPRPPCGGRLAYLCTVTPPTAFQSTSSVWRTTAQGAVLQRAGAISIHVLRVEDDMGG